MSIEIARKLLGSGLVQRDEVERALFTHARTGVPVLRAMIDAGALSHRILEEELSRLDAPTVRSVAPVLKLAEQLPPGLCRTLQAVPVRLDPRTGTVEVAAVDPLSRQVSGEMSFHLHAPVRVIRAPLSAIDEAIARLERGPSSPDLKRPSSRPPPPSTPPPRPTHHTPPYMGRAELDESNNNTGVPVIRRHNSDMPIPLVRRAGSSLSPQQRPAIDGTIAEALVRSTSSSQLRPASSIPPTRQGFVSRAPGMPLPSAAPVMEAIRMAETRDEAIDLLINGLAMVAGRVGVFAVRKGAFRGYRCNEALGEGEVFRSIVLPQDVPSILATAAAAGYYLGPIPQTSVHADLLRVMGGYSAEVSATPVRVQGHLALVVLLDDLADAMLATKRSEDLARVTSIALGAILHSGR